MTTFETQQEARDYSVSNPLETVEYKHYYNVNGQLDEHRFYLNGKRHGESKSYHYNGKLDEHCFFVNGLEHGEFKSYWDNGQLYEHSFYVNGKLHGEYKAYHGDGQLWDHYFFVNDNIFDVDHLSDGSYKSRCVLITLFDGNLLDEDI